MIVVLGQEISLSAQLFAICFLAVTALSCRFAFTIPIVFSTLITGCLIAAAWI